MRIYQSLSTLVGAVLVTRSSAELEINGWFDCHMTDASPDTTSSFECAEARVPLCHEGICDSTKTIDIFVKRLAPTNEPSGKAVWMLQGGPGMSSVNLEGAMTSLHAVLNGTASVYTMDHRGTGRSFLLQCDAAQAFTGGSPGGFTIGYDEVPDCVQDILFQIDGHTAAFSVTSAAKDVVRLVTELNADEDVYIYGASYGTYLTERVMHLAPPNVKGYILDGVIGESHYSFAHFGSKRIEPGKYFASLCEQDAVCSAKYTEGIEEFEDLHSLWKDTYAKLDAAATGENACVDYIRGDSTTDSASDIIRTLFASAFSVSDVKLRTVIPAVFAALRRCSPEDVASLQQVLGTSEGQTVADLIQNSTQMVEQQPFDAIHGASPFLMHLIKASELWTFPSLPWEDEKKLAHEGVFTVGMADEFAWHCVMTGNLSDPACPALMELGEKKGVDYSTLELTPFVYETDEYYRKVVTIPEGASVMVMNGKLDFQTVHSGAVQQYKEMHGHSKLLVEFDVGGHCPGIAPSTPDDETFCGYLIMGSYIYADGDVNQVDTSCLSAIPAINFDVGGEPSGDDEASTTTETKMHKTNTHKKTHNKPHKTHTHKKPHKTNTHAHKKPHKVPSVHDKH